MGEEVATLRTFLHSETSAVESARVELKDQNDVFAGTLRSEEKTLTLRLDEARLEVKAARLDCDQLRDELTRWEAQAQQQGDASGGQGDDWYGDHVGGDGGDDQDATPSFAGSSGAHPSAKTAGGGAILSLG